MKFIAATTLYLGVSTALAVPALHTRHSRTDSSGLQRGNAGGDPVADAPPSETIVLVEDGEAVEDVVPPVEDVAPPVAPPMGGDEPVEGGEGGEAGEGEEGAENEVELEAQFGDIVALEGGDLKQDVLYPPNLEGVFEVEFQNAEARTLVVTENPTPAAAPAGFSLIENVTWIVELAGGAEGLTLQKIDYILNADSALDISAGQIGRLEGDTFVIGPAVGELEFELEENELTLTVDDMNGEWGVFLPDAAAGDETGSEAGAGDAAAGASLLEALLAFVQGSAAGGA